MEKKVTTADLPPYAKTIRERRIALYPLVKDAAAAAGMSHSYWDNIENGRVCATHGVLEKIASALRMSPNERFLLINDAASYNETMRPEQAEQSKRWLRFQAIHTYGTPQFNVFREEFHDACRRSGNQGMETGVIRKIAVQLKEEYQEILQNINLKSTQELAQALLTASGLAPAEAAEYGNIRPSEISTLLHGHKGRNEVTTHSVLWERFAHALMMDRFELQEPLHNALNRLRLGQPVHIRSVKEIIDEKTIGGKAPGVAVVILELCNDRIGDGKPFASMEAIEKQCGVGHSRFRKAAIDGYAPLYETVRKLAGVLGLDSTDTDGLLELSRLQRIERRGYPTDKTGDLPFMN